MTIPVCQGYALLVVMMLGAGVGGGWLSITGSTYNGSGRTGGMSPGDVQALVHARQSLLSYTALYPYLYGPAGTGPAHLPCPDTDSGGNAPPTNPFNADHRRDGPNPPCASLGGSQGQLPRHTVLPGYRYMFHAEPGQVFGYEVASEVVNNPTNRVVNLQALQRLGKVSVAWINLGFSGEGRAPARVPITGSAMYKASAASVTAWLIQRVADSNATHCLSTVSSEDRHSETGSTQMAFSQSALVLETDHSESTADPALDSDPITEIAYCYPVTGEAGSCADTGFYLRLLDDPGSSGERCLFETLNEYTMEGIPATRHWFFRNRWYESIAISSTDHCAEPAQTVPSCVLRPIVTSTYPHQMLPTVIELQWQRAS